MTSIVFPSIIGPSSASWRLRANTQTHTSPLDGTTQTLALPGARWEASLSWQTLPLDAARTLSSWLWARSARTERFRFGPYQAVLSRRATGTGTPVINGANQAGDTLQTRGWAANADAFRAGDFLSYIDTTGRVRLHQVGLDVTANASGNAAVLISPPIRRAGADGAAVEFVAPFGFFRLAQDMVDVSMRPGPFGAVSFEIVEAIV